MKSGIVHHPGRQQPYTVWYNGEIYLFTDSVLVARFKFEQIQARKEKASDY